MKNLAKGIKIGISTAILAMTCCTPESTVKAAAKHHEQPRKETIAYAETHTADQKDTLAKKLERIHRFMKKNNRNYIVFGTAEQQYLFAIEDIDKDGKSDYVLLIGKEGDKKFPLSPAAVYIEDTTKKTGPGSVDSMRYRGKENKDRKNIPEKISNESLRQIITEYEQLIKPSKTGKKPDKAKLRKLRQKFMQQKAYLSGASAAYTAIINGLDQLLSRYK